MTDTKSYTFLLLWDKAKANCDQYDKSQWLKVQEQLEAPRMKADFYVIHYDGIPTVVIQRFEFNSPDRILDQYVEEYGMERARLTCAIVPEVILS